MVHLRIGLREINGDDAPPRQVAVIAMTNGVKLTSALYEIPDLHGWPSSMAAVPSPGPSLKSRDATSKHQTRALYS